MRAFLLSATIFVAFALPASADHCETWSTTEPDLAVGVFGVTPVLYVHEEWNDAIDTWSIWTYEESNGIPGLQREDESVDDTCHGMIRGDTIFF